MELSQPLGRSLHSPWLHCKSSISSISSTWPVLRRLQSGSFAPVCSPLAASALELAIACFYWYCSTPRAKGVP